MMKLALKIIAVILVLSAFAHFVPLQTLSSDDPCDENVKILRLVKGDRWSSTIDAQKTKDLQATQRNKELADKNLPPSDFIPCRRYALYLL